MNDTDVFTETFRPFVRNSLRASVIFSFSDIFITGKRHYDRLDLIFSVILKSRSLTDKWRKTQCFKAHRLTICTRQFSPSFSENIGFILSVATFRMLRRHSADLGLLRLWMRSVGCSFSTAFCILKNNCDLLFNQHPRVKNAGKWRRGSKCSSISWPGVILPVVTV